MDSNVIAGTQRSKVLYIFCWRGKKAFLLYLMTKVKIKCRKGRRKGGLFGFFSFAAFSKVRAEQMDDVS